MQYKNKQNDRHLSGIVHYLSLYRVLAVSQLSALYPDLPPEKLRLLLKRLKKAGRITLDADRDLVRLPCGCEGEDSIIAAFWVLLDFLPSVNYHCASDFPAVLTFYTDSEAFDVIHVPEEKEILLNHALSALPEEAPRRLVIIDDTAQIPLITFPGISAFCLVDADGNIQYFRRQGDTFDG